MKLIDQLDSIYTRTLDDPATNADRKFIKTVQERIIAKCDEWLTSPTANLSGETRANFRTLRKNACLTLDELEHGEDVLLHWHTQRELLLKLFK